MGLSQWGSLWILLTGEIAGSVAASAAYRLVHGRD
jgi:glycerol uptake facilitator-like aquaporin